MTDYIWPCRWCGHLDWQHDIPPGITLDPSRLAPCHYGGCDCEDYDELDADDADPLQEGSR